MTSPIADPLLQALDSKESETLSWNSRSPSNLRIGNRLRTRRISYGISREALSERLGIDRDDLDLFETGTKRMNANLLLNIAKVLDVQLDYFFQDYASEEV
jgi:DNA-binding XRE family transcriptional regulator